ncbi:MAG: enolase C-terminal domain-like protein [Bryobacteraceae bacterium]
MNIRTLRCHVAPMAGSWLTDTVIANPMSEYPEYRARRSSWFGQMSAALIEVELDDGTRGYGFAGGGKGRAVESIVDEQMRALVEGKPVDSNDLVCEQLYRASVFYGRGGLAQCAIAGIDLAMWDARGKIAGRPVHALLGPARAEMEAYYTGNDPEALAEFGIRHMKIAIPYGPANGEAGMRANEAAVARAREVLGRDGFLALDIYMAWDPGYTVRMMERLEKYDIRWIEEPVFPDDYAGYREIRRRVPCKVSGGEHEYTLEGFRRLVGEGCVDLAQPDIYRAGGITGLRKIARLAEEAGVELICHGVGAPTYHFLATLPEATTPYCEFLDIFRGGVKEWVLEGEPRVSGGRLGLGDAPGFGYRFNDRVWREGLPVATIW